MGRPPYCIDRAAACNQKPAGIAARVLERAGVGLKKARVGVEAQSGASGKGLVLQIVEIPLSSKADAALKQAEREARRLGEEEPGRGVFAHGGGGVGKPQEAMRWRQLPLLCKATSQGL